MISWKISRNESLLITQIVNRAAAEHGVSKARLRGLTMDLTACHANGNPLDFAGLLAADPLNFTHDVFGIERHINRNTGKLEDFFVPRYSQRIAA